jgi:hypothetical protein
MRQRESCAWNFAPWRLPAAACGAPIRRKNSCLFNMMLPDAGNRLTWLSRSVEGAPLAHRRARSGCDPEGGASAVPGRGFAKLRSGGSETRPAGHDAGLPGAGCPGGGRR